VVQAAGKLEEERKQDAAGKQHLQECKGARMLVETQLPRRAPVEKQGEQPHREIEGAEGDRAHDVIQQRRGRDSGEIAQYVGAEENLGLPLVEQAQAHGLGDDHGRPAQQRKP
jgi:hypothetical protein